MAYSTLAFSPNEILTSAKMTQVSDNFEAILDGSAIPANWLEAAMIPTGLITAGKTSFGGNYTTSEVNTGFTDYDGKTIYKRTFTGTISQSGGTRNSVTLLAGVHRLIKAEGWYSEGGAVINTVGSQRMASSGVVDGSDAMLNVGGNATFYTRVSPARTNEPYAVTIYYTKP